MDLTDKAVAFAEQIDKVEACKKERGFGDIFKGLYVFGGVIVRPKEAYAIQETTSGIPDSEWLEDASV